MRRREREFLRARFGFRCAYCGVHEREVGAELTVDHFQPVSRGGTDEPQNLIYSCHACNEFKGDFWQSGSDRRILHPELDDLSQHLAEQPDGTLAGLTPMGEFHIQRLQMNRPALVQYRLEQRRVAAADVRQEELLQRLVDLEDRLAHVQTTLRSLSLEPPSEE